MDTPSQKVTRLMNQACGQYPGGKRAVFLAIQEMEGVKKSEQTFYADFNPSPSSNGNLKVRDFIAAMQITGDITALRYLASLFGCTLMALSNCEPDAPNLEAEMLQDYPALVDFHKGCQEHISGKLDIEALNAKEDAAISDIRQTFAMAVKNAKG